MTEQATVECWNCEAPLEEQEQEDGFVDQDQERDREFFLCSECGFFVEEPEIVAALVLDVKPEDLEPLGGGSHVSEFRGGGLECMVVEDRDFEQVWKECIENYVHENILPDVPESIRYYFDLDSFADDARSDGLAVWFGYTYEHDVNVNGTWYNAFTRG